MAKAGASTVVPDQANKVVTCITRINGGLDRFSGMISYYWPYNFCFQVHVWCFRICCHVRIPAFALGHKHFDWGNVVLILLFLHFIIEWACVLYNQILSSGIIIDS